MSENLRGHGSFSTGFTVKRMSQNNGLGTVPSIVKSMVPGWTPSLPGPIWNSSRPPCLKNVTTICHVAQARNGSVLDLPSLHSHWQSPLQILLSSPDGAAMCSPGSLPPSCPIMPHHPPSPTLTSPCLPPWLDLSGETLLAPQSQLQDFSSEASLPGRTHHALESPTANPNHPILSL